ncbi:endonuclease/exonuclease/phosphatase family protein [Streptosporangium sp. NPDC000563]|uniref:endonuclease/exonuclease/phosphatase family protein n=1 Tax=unclassified Streptosporangium TaxID=2632669 RepID=UPI00331B5371
MSGDDRQQLSILQAGEHYARPGQVRVLTLNVQHANPARSRRQADWLAAQDADVVVLTEVTPGAHAITQALGEHGFSVHLGDGGADYLTVVASRIGKQEPAPQIRPGHLPHRCAAIRLHLDDGSSIGVVGLYVPSRGPQQRRNVDKRLFQDAVTELLPALADDLAVTGPIVIAGDLNVVERGHKPHHAVFGNWEYTFYDAFAAAGYGDAFRRHHPDLDDYSWYGRRSGEGYRFDHLFCSPVGAVIDCRYVHEPRTSGLSDHAAMTATITLPTGTP